MKQICTTVLLVVLLSAVTPEVQAQGELQAPASANAVSQTRINKPAEILKVKQVFRARGLLVAEVPKELGPVSIEIGAEYLATLESKRQCSLEVLDVNGVNVTLKIENCLEGDVIQAGMSLERSLLPKALASAKVQAAVNPAGDDRSTRQAPVVKSEPSARSAAEQAYEPRFYDLSFMPSAGRFVFSPYVDRSTIKETVSALGQTAVAYEKIAVSGGFQVDYGVSDKVRFGLELKHSLSSQMDETYGPASGSLNGTASTYVYKGLYDPQISIEYKALDQATSPMNGFVGIAVKPSFIENKMANTNSDGTNGTGGNDIVLAGRLTQESYGFGFELGSSFRYRDQRVTKTTTEDRNTTGGDVFEVYSRLQGKFSPATAVNLSVRWNGVGATEMKQGASPSIVLKAHSFFVLQAGMSFILVPDRFLLDGELSHVGSLDTKIKSNGVEIDNSGSMSSLRLSARYMF